jgi:hypothetical protein
MYPGPLLDLLLENLPFRMQWAGVIFIKVAQTKQAMVLDGPEFHRPQDIEKPDFCRRPGRDKAAMVPLL